MAEQTNSGTGSTSQSGSAHPAQASNPVRQAANPPPAGAEGAIDRTRGAQSQDNPRSRGFRPAPDWSQGQQRQSDDGRGQQGQQGHGQQQADGDQQGQGQQQQPGGEPQKIKIGDVEYSADQVNEALRFKSEQEIRKSGLPASPDQYQLTLPADFKAPEGINFQFDPNSAELQNFRHLAHARGLDQQTFSEALGIYAANRIGEQQQLATGRNAEMAKLGSAAHNRIAAVETWLKSQVGGKAALLVSQLKNYPVASFIEVFETLARNASNQNSAPYSQSHRSEEENTGRIPNYDSLSFSEKRAQQDALAARLRGGR